MFRESVGERRVPVGPFFRPTPNKNGSTFYGVRERSFLNPVVYNDKEGMCVCARARKGSTIFYTSFSGV